MRLLGYTDKGNERIIITEYVPNGTLREHLDGKYRFLPFPFSFSFNFYMGSFFTSSAYVDSFGLKVRNYSFCEYLEHPKVQRVKGQGLLSDSELHLHPSSNTAGGLAVRVEA